MSSLSAPFPVGSGAYRYRLNGEDVPVRETWTVTRDDNGDCTVVSRRDAPGVAIAVTAEVSAGEIACCTLLWQSGSTAGIEAVYTSDSGGLRVERHLNGQPQQTREIAAAEGGLILYPLMRVFTGPVIRALHHVGGRGTVVVPSIAEPHSPQSLLWPDISVRRVYREQAGPGQLWRFIGGQYGADASFYLDEQGCLLRYCWEQDDKQSWDVSLVPDS